MRAPRRPTLALATAIALAGCHGGPMPRTPRAVASAEPALDPDAPGAPLVTNAPPARPVTIVDRHPLLSKPRDYYENAGSNKIVKTGAATLVGIPAGILGEMRQIVIGRPAEQRSY